jgi:hypothetical protein
MRCVPVAQGDSHFSVAQDGASGFRWVGGAGIMGRVNKAGAVGSKSKKRGHEGEHAIAIILKVGREGSREFSVDSEMRADIVESSVCPCSRQRNSLKVDESTSFHACQK